jgi:hypothetical protein
MIAILLRDQRILVPVPFPFFTSTHSATNRPRQNNVTVLTLFLPGGNSPKGSALRVGCPRLKTDPRRGTHLCTDTLLFRLLRFCVVHHSFKVRRLPPSRLPPMVTHQSGIQVSAPAECRWSGPHGRRHQGNSQASSPAERGCHGPVPEGHHIRTRASPEAGHAQSENVSENVIDVRGCLRMSISRHINVL